MSAVSLRIQTVHSPTRSPGDASSGTTTSEESSAAKRGLVDIQESLDSGRTLSREELQDFHSQLEKALNQAGPHPSLAVVALFGRVREQLSPKAPSAPPPPRTPKPPSYAPAQQSALDNVVILSDATAADAAFQRRKAAFEVEMRALEEQNNAAQEALLMRQAEEAAASDAEMSALHRRMLDLFAPAPVVAAPQDDAPLTPEAMEEAPPAPISDSAPATPATTPPQNVEQQTQEAAQTAVAEMLVLIEKEALRAPVEPAAPTISKGEQFLNLLTACAATIGQFFADAWDWIVAHISSRNTPEPTIR